VFQSNSSSHIASSGKGDVTIDTPVTVQSTSWALAAADGESYSSDKQAPHSSLQQQGKICSCSVFAVSVLLAESS